MPTNRLPQFQQALRRAGLEVEEFASAIGVHRATVFRAAKGWTDSPDVRAEIDALIRDYPAPPKWRPLKAVPRG